VVASIPTLVITSPGLAVLAVRSAAQKLMVSKPNTVLRHLIGAFAGILKMAVSKPNMGVRLILAPIDAIIQTVATQTIVLLRRLIVATSGIFKTIAPTAIALTSFTVATLSVRSSMQKIAVSRPGISFQNAVMGIKSAIHKIITDAAIWIATSTGLKTLEIEGFQARSVSYYFTAYTGTYSFNTRTPKS